MLTNGVGLRRVNVTGEHRCELLAALHRLEKRLRGRSGGLGTRIATE